MIKKTICLNMIVKNETNVIKRCLSLIVDLIDYWVIVDTGSSDGTQEYIKNILKDIPGELHERPWVNFAHNRNEALDLAKNKGDYLLFVDADDQLQFSEPLNKQLLERDLYSVEYHHDNNVSQRVFLVNNHLDWRWKGPVHERIECPVAKDGPILKGVVNIAWQDGARSKDMKQKHLDAAKILEKEIEKEPENARSIFHLATSYHAAEEYERALKNYEKRATMGGYEYEVFVSLWYIGIAQEKLNLAPEIFLKSYFKAYQFRPHRIEPLYCAANHYMKVKCYLLSYLICQFALAVPFVNEYYHTQMWIYDHGLRYLFAECCYRLGKYDEAFDALTLLLATQNLPLDIREICEKNYSLPVFENKRGNQNG